MKSILTLGAVLVAGASQAAIITQWDFNGTSSSTVQGGVSSPTASIGLGTASLLGVTGSFSSGVANGGSSDPVTTSPPNFGWQTTGYAAQGTENGQRGVQFAVSTVGYEDIMVSFDVRKSNTSSRFTRFDYSANGGTTWTEGALLDGNAGDTWFNLNLNDLSTDSSVDNNANFVFRMVAVFDPNIVVAGQYSPSNSGSSYAATGTLRWDMVTVSGTEAVPEPATMAVLAGLGLAVARRRKK